MQWGNTSTLVERNGRARSLVYIKGGGGGGGGGAEEARDGMHPLPSTTF